MHHVLWFAEEHCRCFEKPVTSVCDVQDSFEGVQHIASGGEASAVVDKAGKLWMWGLLAESSDSGIRLPAPKTSFGEAPAPCVSRNQKQPTIVPDLDPVTSVALGKNHVLAVTSTS
jgi:alpha-tubulin suppressor-like RCC1 family protein